MDVIYGLIPFVLLFGFLAVLVFIWMAKKGQFDDLDRAAHQIFLEDEEQSEPSPRTGAVSAANEKNGDGRPKDKPADCG